MLRKRRRSLRGLALELALAAGTGGAVTLAQKTIAKDWIVTQASTVADPDERKLTVNYLTKILLGASGMSQAEVVALALRLNGYRQVRYSQETVRLAELLAAAKPATKFKVLASLGKLRKELGLPAAPSAVKPTAPTVQPMKTVARAAPAKPVKPVTPKATPRTPPPQLNPRQLRARDLNRKLGRSVAGWKTMSVVRKIAHLKSEMMAKTNRMPACKGLADRHVLQEEITDLSELVVLLRAGKA
jgi:hypothetical protein